MNIPEFYDLLTARRLETREQAWVYANDEVARGNRRVRDFMLQQRDLTAIFARFAEAKAAGKPARPTRLEILEEAATTRCTCHELGKWASMAAAIGPDNGYSNQEIERALLNALEHGRGRHRNVWFVGDTQRGKTFMLDGLAAVFTSFEAPSDGSYQLADLKGCDIIILNEFTWTPQFCPWGKFKELLEGRKFKVGVPKSEAGAKNYIFDEDSPLFGSSAQRIHHKLPKELEQANARVSYFELYKHYPVDPRAPRMAECKKCVADWLLAARTTAAAAPGEPGVGPAQQPAPQCDDAAAAQGAPSMPTPRDPNGAWAIQKEKDTYHYEDLPGRCFRCGEPGHEARDCENAPAGAASSSSASSGSPRRAFCGACGSLRAASRFCEVSGRTH